MALFSLVYVSLAVRDMTEDDLREILQVSRINNEQYDITGMLLYRDRYFIQVLEGDEDAVRATYSKIEHDPRHKNLIIAYQENILEREFDRWAMGFNHLDNLASSELPAFSDFLEKPVDTEFFKNQGRVMTLLRAFRDKIYF